MNEVFASIGIPGVPVVFTSEGIYTLNQRLSILEDIAEVPTSNRNPGRVRIGIYGRFLGIRFREDFVLAPELLLQGGDPLVLAVGRGWGAGLEGGGTGLEELLLRAVEYGRVDAVPVTKVRDGDVFEEMAPPDGNFSLAVNRLRIYLAMGRLPHETITYSSRPFFLFRLKQDT